MRKGDSKVNWIAGVVGVIMLLAATFVLGLIVGWNEGRDDTARAYAEANSHAGSTGTLLLYGSSMRGYWVAGGLAILGSIALAIAARKRRR